MSIKRIDIPKGIVDPDAFVAPTIDFLTDTGKRKSYFIISKTRNGVVNVIRYVPLDIRPNCPKPEKVNETLEFHLEGDTVIPMNFITATTGDAVIDALAKDIMSPNILTIRDKEGFIKLSYRYGPSRFWKVNSIHGSHWPTARISIIDESRNDQVSTALAHAIIALFEEKVSIHYPGQVYPGISTTMGQLISITDMLSVVADMLTKMDCTPASLETACSIIVRTMHVPYDEYC